MHIYEFITPSDPITFKAVNDKVALVCAFMLGKGRAGCDRKDENGNTVTIPSLLMFSEDAGKEIVQFLEQDLGSFLESNREEIQKGFDSFCYGTIEERKTYDDAVEAITDPEKLKEFKAKHEDRNRTSMSEWVAGAWQFAEHFKNKE